MEQPASDRALLKKPKEKADKSSTIPRNSRLNFARRIYLPVFMFLRKNSDYLFKNFKHFISFNGERLF